MYDHHEDAVRIAYYFIWDTEADEYSVTWLCEDCAAERGGDLVIAGDLSAEDAKRCEDCDRPNDALLEAMLLDFFDETPVKIGVYDDHAAYAGSDDLQYAYLCKGCAEGRGANVTFLSPVGAGERLRCDDCGNPNRDHDEE